jgi:hypothetical protein
VSNDLILAVGALAGAVAAAFGTVYAAVHAARRERAASALKAYEQVVEERRRLAEDMHAELIGLRLEVIRLRAELVGLGAEMDRLRDERNAAVLARDREAGR